MWTYFKYLDLFPFSFSKYLSISFISKRQRPSSFSFQASQPNRPGPSPFSPQPVPAYPAKRYGGDPSSVGLDPRTPARRLYTLSSVPPSLSHTGGRPSTSTPADVAPAPPLISRSPLLPREP